MALPSEVIDSRRVPRIGPYSQATRVGDLVFTAGQPGINPATGAVAGDTFDLQARQAFANLAAVLFSIDAIAVATRPPAHSPRQTVFI